LINEIDFGLVEIVIANVVRFLVGFLDVIKKDLGVSGYKREFFLKRLTKIMKIKIYEENSYTSVKDKERNL